ncbi:kunitz type trypsin inhibitor 106-like [Gastrolobium bilobum]|uniref:kunitz type trypsin inhibitor 106-like n=1 Tax=Gastrolobium bilobum TaxID=150636 RepID=UPI002AB22A45|nr:kunitz type trypsin inhibitor 106-like [Gastrolobium bilobum]
MSMRSFERSLSLVVVCLITATTALAQSDNAPVLDTKGHPLKYGKDYYIKPATTDNGGPFTLIDRNGPCDLYVGQENSNVSKGLPVVFMAFAKEDDAVKVNRDFKVAFSAETICVQSTEWNLGEKDPQSGKRLITTTGNDGEGTYFRIVETHFEGIYNIQWCPTDVCPLCKFDCGTVGGLHENENGKILLALDGNDLPVVFEMA